MSITLPSSASATSRLRAAHFPTQRRLPVKIEIFAPLMDIAGARAALQKDQDEILDLIEDRTIAWAWDIGTGIARAEIRIFAKCIRGCQTTNGKCGLAGEDENKIIGQILARENNPWIYGKRLRHLLNCSSELIIDLIEGGDLSILPGTAWHRGRKGTPCVTRPSVITFLQARRMFL